MNDKSVLRTNHMDFFFFFLHTGDHLFNEDLVHSGNMLNALPKSKGQLPPYIQLLPIQKQMASTTVNSFSCHKTFCCAI